MPLAMSQSQLGALRCVLEAEPIPHPLAKTGNPWRPSRGRGEWVS
jgi:hypothetical protein